MAKKKTTHIGGACNGTSQKPVASLTYFHEIAADLYYGTKTNTLYSFTTTGIIQWHSGWFILRKIKWWIKLKIKSHIKEVHIHALTHLPHIEDVPVLRHHLHTFAICQKHRGWHILQMLKWISKIKTITFVGGTCNGTSLKTPSKLRKTWISQWHSPDHYLCMLKSSIKKTTYKRITYPYSVVNYKHLTYVKHIEDDFYFRCRNGLPNHTHWRCMSSNPKLQNPDLFLSETDNLEFRCRTGP